MNFIVRLLAKSAVLGFALPALGLITFSGGMPMAIIATLLIGLVGTGVSLTLLPAIAGEAFGAALFGAVLGGQAGAKVSTFFFGSVLYAAFMWLTSMFFPGAFGLVGIWSTIIAAMILSLTGMACELFEKN